MGSLEPVEVKSHPQVFGAEHVVHVRHSGEVFCLQPPVQRIESRQSFLPAIEKSIHETHVGRHSVKKWSCIFTAEHSDTQVRILLCQRIHHWHEHRGVAQC